MAGLRSWVTTGEITMVSTVAKTLIQVKAPANQRVIIRSLRMTGKQPAGGTDTPGKLRLTRSTSNFGTGTTATPGKQNPSNPETLQVACASNFTVEPTSPTDGGLYWEWQPQGGIIEFLPPGAEIEVPGGQSAQFELTITGTPVVLLTLGLEE